MRLVVGLGNPGDDYIGTRHNVGFEVLARIARRHAPGEPARSRHHGLLVEARVQGSLLLLMRPMTFMNRSGQCVSETLRYYKLDPVRDMLVVVDDTALSCGHLRIRDGGGGGGHNGLTDIAHHLGHDNYSRLRIGIDSPGDISQSEYVLGRFHPEQKDAIEAALGLSVEAVLCWAEEGCDEAMNRYNTRRSA